MIREMYSRFLVLSAALLLAGFPIGRLVPGNGGFNAPWSWHLERR